MSNSNQAMVVAVMAHRLPRHEPAPALASVGMALLVLAVLGAIVLLVGRDARHLAAPEGRRAEVACGSAAASVAQGTAGPDGTGLMEGRWTC